jgi:hypothetical protein
LKNEGSQYQCQELLKEILSTDDKRTMVTAKAMEEKGQSMQDFSR